jgi:hypothetical protein
VTPNRTVKALGNRNFFGVGGASPFRCPEALDADGLMLAIVLPLVGMTYV